MKRKVVMKWSLGGLKFPRKGRGHNNEASIPLNEALSKIIRQLLGPTQRDWLPIGGFLLLALFLDGVFFTGYYGSDDITYLDAASAIANGEAPDFTEFGSARLAMVLPMAAMIFITGQVLPAVNLVFIGYHLLLIALTYRLGATLHGRTAGLVAAVLTTGCPLVLYYSTMILPDFALSCFIIGSMIGVVEGANAIREERSRSAILWIGASAVFIVMAYSVKLSALLPIPVFVLYLLIMGAKKRVRTALTLAVFFSMVVFLLITLEQLVLEKKYENVQSNRLTRFIEQSEERIDLDLMNRNRMYAPMDRPITLWDNLEKRLGSPYLAILTLSVLVYPLLVGRSWLMVSVFTWGTLYQVFGSVSFKTYIPFTLQARYFLVYVVLTFIMAGFCAERVRRAVRKAVDANSFGRQLAFVVLTVVSLLTLIDSIRRVNTFTGERYFYSVVQGTRKALELARNSYPDWPIVIPPRLYGRVRPLFQDSSEAQQIIPTNEISDLPLDEFPKTFLYLAPNYHATQNTLFDRWLQERGPVGGRFSPMQLGEVYLGRFGAGASRLQNLRYYHFGGALPSPNQFPPRTVNLWKIYLDFKSQG